jgi:hypothetical protein
MGAAIFGTIQCSAGVVSCAVSDRGIQNISGLEGAVDVSTETFGLALPPDHIQAALDVLSRLGRYE